MHSATDLSRSRVAWYCSSNSRLPALDEPVDRPPGQPEQPQLLGRLRVDGEPVRVVGVPLGRADLGGVAVLPDPALPQQPVGRPPGQHQHDGAHQAKPASTTAEASPPTMPTRLLAMKSRLRYIGGPVMPRSNSREVVRSSASSGSSRWPMPGRIDTAVDQAFVEPGRQQVAEIHADRGQDRADDQHQHEDHADEGQGRGEPSPVSTARTSQADRHREDGRQHAAEHQQAHQAAVSRRRPGAARRRTATPAGSAAVRSCFGLCHGPPTVRVDRSGF